MFHSRFDNGSRFLVLALITMLSVAPALAEDPKNDPKKDPKQDKQTEPKATEARQKASTEGIVLRPNEVDGSVSAYAAAVRKADPKTKVYTNADLERMWAGDPSAWATAPSSGGEAPAAAPDLEATVKALEAMESQTAQGRERAKSIADAERELAQANAAVSNLEKQLLAVKNPYAARPQLSEEEKAARAEEGDTVAKRLQRVEEQLKEARLRASKAREQLDRLRR